MKKIFLCTACAIFLINCSNKQAAVVNGTIIHEKEVLDAVNDVNPETVERLGKENIKKNILDGLVERQLLLCKIRDEKYDKRDDVQKSWVPFKRESDIKYFINDFLPEKQPVSGKVLEEEYEKNKEMFKTEGQVHARHILIRTGKGMHSEEEALTKITSISKELNKDGSNFSELAKKYSECPSSTQGGDLGFFTRGQMVKPFEDAAFLLKKGEITKEPVKTVYGYHLIYAEEVKEVTYPSIDEVKKHILPGIYIADIEKEYGLKVYFKKDIVDDIVGEVKKLNLKYNSKMLRDDLELMVGKIAAGKYTQSSEDKSNIVTELLRIKIFEDKMKNLSMDKDKNYIKYSGKLYDEFLSSNYLENSLFKDVNVTENEVRFTYQSNFPAEMLVQQFGKKFSTDAVFRHKIENEQIFPFIRQQLKDQKRSEVYIKLVDELKKKYPFEIKIKYKTT